MKRIFLLVFMFSMFAGVGYADCTKDCQNCTEGDCQNGQGTMTYYDGTKYVGQWKAGKRNGQGTLTLADGSKYIGQYEDDHCQNGQGTMTWPDGRKKVGQFKNGSFISQ